MVKNSEFVESRALGVAGWITMHAYQRKAIEERIYLAKMEIKSIFEAISAINGDIRKKNKYERIREQ
jgi:hypothetical protein